MSTPWSAEQVLALAPDAGSAAAGRTLASPAPWSGTGVRDSPGAVWGLCAGSGKSPYSTVVDLTGPAFRCSCPSRKFPCKHALGLLLLWSAGQVSDGEVPGWAATWLTSRAGRTEGPAQRAPSTAAADPAAGQRRAEQRAERVAAGADELDRWLTDQVRAGLAPLERAGYGPFEAVAARMVDAQAPGLAAGVRRLPSVVASGPGWPGRLLEELALLHLATAGHARLGELPAPLAACVRREVGYPVSRADVLAGPAVRDRWQVLALRDSEEERLSTRRVWLLGSATGRHALVLSFAPAGQSLDAGLGPGTTVDADLHFYPGAAPHRALVGERHGEPDPLGPVPAGSLQDAATAWAAALAADPWTRSWPAVVGRLVPAAGEPAWSARDADGRTVDLLGAPSALWRLLAVSGGHPVTAFCELTPTGLRPLSVLDDDRLVLL